MVHRVSTVGLSSVLSGGVAFAHPVRVVKFGDVYTGYCDTDFNLAGTDYNFPFGAPRASLQPDGRLRAAVRAAAQLPQL